MLPTPLIAALVLPFSPSSANLSLVGTWTSKVQFVNGAFSSVKDLEFMLSFNLGGTMNESSNYDATPPVAPAYGIWRKVGTRKFEAKYVFVQTAPPKDFKTIQDGGGWPPSSKGTLLEKIELSADGRTYRSRITMKMVDLKGKVLETSQAVGRGERMRF